MIEIDCKVHTFTVEDKSHPKPNEIYLKYIIYLMKLKNKDSHLINHLQQESH